jgi:hypothetical protein
MILNMHRNGSDQEKIRRKHEGGPEQDRIQTEGFGPLYLFPDKMVILNA